MLRARRVAAGSQLAHGCATEVLTSVSCVARRSKRRGSRSRLACLCRPRADEALAISEGGSSAPLRDRIRFSCVVHSPQAHDSSCSTIIQALRYLSRIAASRWLEQTQSLSVSVLTI